jgi:hypothetical protein
VEGCQRWLGEPARAEGAGRDASGACGRHPPPAGSLLPAPHPPCQPSILCLTCRPSTLRDFRPNNSGRSRNYACRWAGPCIVTGVWK